MKRLSRFIPLPLDSVGLIKLSAGGIVVLIVTCLVSVESQFPSKSQAVALKK